MVRGGARSPLCRGAKPTAQTLHVGGEGHVCGFYEQITSTAEVNPSHAVNRIGSSGRSSVLSVQADRFDHEVEFVGAG